MIQRGTGWPAAAALAVVVAGCAESPEAAFRAIGAAAERGDWGAVYDRIDTRSRARLDAALVIAALDAASALSDVDQARFEEIHQAGGRVLFIRMAVTNQAFSRGFLPAEVLSIRVVGTAAELKVARLINGQEQVQVVPMVREDGLWKLAPAARRRGRKPRRLDPGIGPSAPAPSARPPSTPPWALSPPPSARSWIVGLVGASRCTLREGDWIACRIEAEPEMGDGLIRRMGRRIFGQAPSPGFLGGFRAI